MLWIFVFCVFVFVLSITHPLNKCLSLVLSLSFYVGDYHLFKHCVVSVF